MATSFKIADDKYFVETPVSDNGASSATKILCCVDVSGSMQGSPIENVNNVLQEIYEATGTNYDLLCYNRQVTRIPIAKIKSQPLVAGGWTDFSKIFDAMRDELVKDMQDTTFIFMTDGEHTQGKECLDRSTNAFKMIVAALGTVKITIHVIGFGNVNSSLLESIRKMGNVEGLFRYSTKSIDLSSDFNDMFLYAACNEYQLKIRENVYSSKCNAESAQFLVTENLGNVSEIMVKSVKEQSWNKMAMRILKDNEIKPLSRMKALNKLSPQNEADTKEILTRLNEISSSGANINDKLEIEQWRKEISSRMMEYLQLFTQIKMGSVPEGVKLKLNALRHAGKFSDVQRQNKLDLRVNKNVEYFKKTDIAGILDGYKRDMNSNAWKELKELDQWTCDVSGRTLSEIMKDSSDNVLCVGLFVERDASAIDSPSAGLQLLKVTNITVSFDDFIDSMRQSSHKNDENPFCIINDEKVNGILPLYLHKEHFKRIRILEGLWLGHLYTLDSYGYHKSQEVALLKLLNGILQRKYVDNYYHDILPELELVAEFFINESEGFITEYGKDTYEKFIQSVHGRATCKDLTIPLMIGYIKKDKDRILSAVYSEYLGRQLKKGLTKEQTKKMVNRLLYGEKPTIVTLRSKQVYEPQPDDPDYLERSYCKYFQKKEDPIPVIPETNAANERKTIIDPEERYLRSLLYETPHFMNTIMSGPTIEMSSYVPSLDKLRRELLLKLHFDVVPDHVDVDNVLAIVDADLQGEDMIKYDNTEENVAIVAKVASGFKTVEGFAGFLNKYCPSRCGVMFDAIVQQLITGDVCIKNLEYQRRKLVALLSNNVEKSGSLSNVYFYQQLKDIVWTPLVSMEKIEDIVGTEELKNIHENHIKHSRKQFHRYRSSNRPNRHGHSNHNPNMRYLEEFKGYVSKEDCEDFYIVPVVSVV